MESLPSDINLEYLSEVLLRCGALKTGSVRKVSIQDARNTLQGRRERTSR
jgi:hypothetical protein